MALGMTFLFALLVAALASATFLAWRLRGATPHPRRIAGATLIGVALGGAALHPLLRLARTLGGTPLDPFAPGWLTAYGALFGGGLAIAWAAGATARYRALDAFSPAAGLLVLFGRLGCLASGCCFGHPTEGAWGVAYAADSPVFAHHVKTGLVGAHATHALPVVPVAALEVALGGLMVALGMMLPRRTDTGATFRTVALSYAVGRFALELLRADPRPMSGPFSLPQALSLVVVAVVILWSPRRSAATRPRPRPPAPGEAKSSASHRAVDAAKRDP
jgi:prolipoprotein diacylglyceryltransferase